MDFPAEKISGSKGKDPAVMMGTLVKEEKDAFFFCSVGVGEQKQPLEAALFGPV